MIINQPENGYHKQELKYINARGALMKFSINQSELQNALSICAKGSSTRSTLSILAGVYLRADEGSITLQTTNLELSIKVSCPALVEEKGESVVPAKLFLDIVKNLPDMAVRIEADDATAVVFCDTTTFSLKALNPLDFPAFPEVEAQQEAQFPFSAFSTMVKRTAKVVSHDETRAILTGVLVSCMGTELKMVATDSYRLAVTETQLDQPCPEEFEAVIAGTFLSDIAALPQSDQPITLALSENQIIVTYQDTTFINRRIEGTFPNYKQLIADGFTTRATLSTHALSDAVRRVSLLSNKVSPVQIKVDADAGVVTLVASSQDIGNAQENLICEIEGESVDIAFNYSFLLDGLNSIDTDAVHLDLFGPMKPGILRATEGENFLYLIMPVRV